VTEPVLSVIVPVHNDCEKLRRCLESLAASTYADREVIVVDDGSSDASAEAARESGARLVSLAQRSGPALARNHGVAHATGRYVFFVDADVCVHADTLEKVAAAFEADATVDALFGSYDLCPAAGNFLSQYKNLFHHHVHQQGSEEASTFWSGCGAMKRSVFLELGGFSADYGRPSIEDIELGARLKRAGCRIVLRKDIQVTHLKRWTLGGIVASDVWDRGVPWTRLILREGQLPDDLNLRMSHRLSALLAYAMLGSGAMGAWLSWWRKPWAPWLWLLTAGSLAGFLSLNRGFYAFFRRERGTLFALRVFPLHLLYYLYSGFALVVGVAGHLLDERVRRWGRPRAGRALP
jgi:glycosyltransferase involved in cell wall biosynthesis